MAVSSRDLARDMEKEMTDDVIRFTAQVSKVTTLADGGIRITLDLPETAIDTATKMMQVRQGGSILEVAAVPVEKAKSGRNRKKRETSGDSSPTY